MDIILTIVCLAIAVMLVSGKPIKIHVEHHHSAERGEPVVTPLEETNYDKKAMKAFDTALAEIHDIMGVSADEE